MTLAGCANHELVDFAEYYCARKVLRLQMFLGNCQYSKDITMKQQEIISTIILTIVCAGILTACAAKPSTTPGTLPVKILPAPEVQFIQTSARQEGENVFVKGQVKRTVTGGRSTIAGHVDIEIINKEGEIICLVVTSYSPKNIPEINGMTSSFTTLIPVSPPQDSFVSVKFHNGHHLN